MRPGGRLKVRVHVAPKRTHVPGVHGGVPHGTHEIVIHESDLDEVRGMVETELGLYERAVETHERKLREFVCEKTRMRDADLPRDPEEWSEHVQLVAERYTGHPLAIFTDIAGRSMRPLRPFAGCPEGVEVIEELPGEMDRSMELAKHAIESMGLGGNGGGNSAEIQQMRDVVQAMGAQIAELQAELHRRKGGRPRKPGSESD